jgi:hypothetical protein
MRYLVGFTNGIQLDKTNIVIGFYHVLSKNWGVTPDIQTFNDILQYPHFDTAMCAILGGFDVHKQQKI